MSRKWLILGACVVVIALLAGTNTGRSLLNSLGFATARLI